MQGKVWTPEPPTDMGQHPTCMSAKPSPLLCGAAEEDSRCSSATRCSRELRAARSEASTSSDLMRPDSSWILASDSDMRSCKTEGSRYFVKL